MCNPIWSPVGIYQCKCAMLQWFHCFLSYKGLTDHWHTPLYCITTTTQCRVKLKPFHTETVTKKTRLRDCQFADFRTQTTASFVFWIYWKNRSQWKLHIKVLVMQTRHSKMETAWLSQRHTYAITSGGFWVVLQVSHCSMIQKYKSWVFRNKSYIKMSSLTNCNN